MVILHQITMNYFILIVFKTLFLKKARDQRFKAPLRSLECVSEVSNAFQLHLNHSNVISPILWGTDLWFLGKMTQCHCNFCNKKAAGHLWNKFFINYSGTLSPKPVRNQSGEFRPDSDSLSLSLSVWARLGSFKSTLVGYGMDSNHCERQQYKLV